jgi:hypothetical protein
MTLEDVGPDNWRHCAALEVEMTLLIYPVVVGQGTRLFPDTGPDTALDLVDSRATSKGITIQVYRPTAPSVCNRLKHVTRSPTRRLTGSSRMAKAHPRRRAAERCESRRSRLRPT